MKKTFKSLCTTLCWWQWTLGVPEAGWLTHSSDAAGGRGVISAPADVLQPSFSCVGRIMNSGVFFPSGHLVGWCVKKEQLWTNKVQRLGSTEGGFQQGGSANAKRRRTCERTCSITPHGDKYSTKYWRYCHQNCL